MKKLTGMSLLYLLCGYSPAMAANLGVITSPPTFLNLIVLLIVIGCLIGSMKILSLLRGGLLFKSWQIFMFGFIALALGQIIMLMNDFEIFLVPSYVVPILLVITFGLLLYGILKTKQTLE